MNTKNFEFEDIKVVNPVWQKIALFLVALSIAGGGIYFYFSINPVVQAEVFQLPVHDVDADMRIGECLVTSLTETGRQNHDCEMLGGGDYFPPTEE